MSLTLNQLQKTFTAMGKQLSSKTDLLLIGAVPCMFFGEGVNCMGETRATMDIDVWRVSSKYSPTDLKKVCIANDLGFNPTGFEEPNTPYLQLVEPDLVFLPTSTGIVFFQSGNLTLRCPDPLCYIASKLVRCNMKDACDCALIAHKFSVTAEQLPEAITKLSTCKGISRSQLEQATENLTLVTQLYNAYFTTK